MDAPKPRLPIGKTVRLEVRGDEIHAWIYFKEDDGLASKVKDFVEQGFIQGISIGFSASKISYRRPTEEERAKGFEQVRVIEKWELLEISVVTIQANYGGLVVKAFHESKPENIENQYLEIKNSLKHIEEIMETKDGRALSKANVKKVNTAVSSIKTALKSLEELLGEAGEEPNDEKDIQEQIDKAVKEALEKQREELEEKSKGDEAPNEITFEEFEKQYNS